MTGQRDQETTLPPAEAVREILSPISAWYHDLCSCLQTCVGSVLRYHGQDPVIALGAAWDFYYLPGEFRREEYYYPTRWGNPGASLAPYHRVTSRWHQPPDAEAGWREVREAIRGGTPAIVAVDNYYLPFRPAHRDVHTNHLIVVHGYDDAARAAYVLETTPPYFQGPLDAAILRAARTSQNPIVGDRDLFYTSTPIRNRWLEVRVDQETPTLTREWVTDVVSTNVARFHAAADGPALSGLFGLRTYLDAFPDRLAGPDGTAAAEELYVFGWAVQASTALHADFLATAGRRLEWRRLTETGRHVGRLAHSWTAVRIMAAHGRLRTAELGPRLTRRTAALVADYEKVLADLEWGLRARRDG